MTRKSPQSTAAYLALAVGILCIGLSGIFVKVAGIPGTVSAFYRMVIAGCVIVPLWLARPRTPVSAPDLRLIILGGVFFALDIALWNTSLLLIPAANATLLANNAPIWVGLASWLLLREKLSAKYWLGLALALGGMVFLVGGTALGQLRLSPGNLMAVGAGMLYAVYLLATQRARSRVPLVTYMALSTLAGIATLLLVNLTLGRAFSGFPPRAWAALAGLGLISQLGGWLAINYALGHLRAAPVSVWLLGQVAVTALVAMPVLGEFPHRAQLLGGALILAGIVAVTQSKEKERIQVPE